MNYKYRRSKLKLKPPNPERQKAFISDLRKKLKKSEQSSRELDGIMLSNWLDFITDPNRRIVKDNSVKIFVYFWIFYFIILWLI